MIDEMSTEFQSSSISNKSVQLVVILYYRDIYMFGNGTIFSSAIPFPEEFSTLDDISGPCTRLDRGRLPHFVP